MSKAVVLRLHAFLETRKRIIILALLILHILPLWIFTYFPSQDGAAHVYNAYVLTALGDDESPLLSEYYKLNLTLFPNWLSHATMFVLMQVFPPLFAEKILLSLIVGLLPLSVFYFLGAARKGQSLYGFLGFLFSYHYLLHMGFYNFAFSVSLYFFALGYFIKHKAEMRLKQIGILNLLCILVYFCHILSYALLMLSLTFMTALSYYRRPQRLLGFLAALAPLYFIMLNYLLSSEVGQASGRIELRWERFVSAEAWGYLLNNQALVSFTTAHQIVTRLMLVMVGAVLVSTLIQKIRKREILAENNRFLLLSGTFAFLYFIMPWSVGSGAWVNDRISLFIFPLLLPFLRQDFHKYLKSGLIVLMILLAIIRVSVTCRCYYALDQSTKEFTSGIELIEPNRIVLGITSDRAPGILDAPPFTHDEFVEPFTHVVNYYCLSNGCVSLNNYEAGSEYFPLNWTDKIPEFIDYIVAWKLDETAPQSSGSSIKGTHDLDVQEITDSLRTDYDLIHSTDNLKLYRHQASQPNSAE